MSKSKSNEQALLDPGLQIDSANMDQRVFAIELSYIFGQRVVEEYNKAIVGENDAKIMRATLLLAGAGNAMIGADFGNPGSGKSRLMKYTHQVVEGLNDSQVATIPHREDLTPAEIVGKSDSLVRTVKTDEGQRTDEVTKKTNSLIHPGTKVLIFDELNRTGTAALNAALQVTQDGGIDIATKEDLEEFSNTIKLNEFELIMAAWNHYGTLHTHGIDPALVSRIAFGTELGRVPKGKMITEASDQIWDHPEKSYSGDPGISPVISIKNLHLLREFVSLQPLGQEARELGKIAVGVMVESFKDRGIFLADPRLSSQFVRGSQALSMIRGHKSVNEEDIASVGEMIITAKLCAAGKVNPSRPGGSLEEMVEDVFSRITSSVKG